MQLPWIDPTWRQWTGAQWIGGAGFGSLCVGLLGYYGRAYERLTGRRPDPLRFPPLIVSHAPWWLGIAVGLLAVGVVLGF